MAAGSEALTATAGAPADHRGDPRIGPNAILQVIQALDAQGLGTAREAIFAAAGAAHWLMAPPESMIGEGGAQRVHAAIRRLLPADEADAILADAGRRTADYLLAWRIPKPAQALLRALPAPLAARALSRAIAAHAWTFAGSGAFRVRPGHPMVYELARNPLVRGEGADRPLCVWHAAVFQRLFQVLVSPRARAVETQCASRGDPACRFEIGWRTRQG